MDGEHWRPDHIELVFEGIVAAPVGMSGHFGGPIVSFKLGWVRQIKRWNLLIGRGLEVDRMYPVGQSSARFLLLLIVMMISLGSSSNAHAGEPWEGLWAADRSDCFSGRKVGEQEGAPFEITRRWFVGLENSCQIRRVTPTGPSTWRFDLSCVGEGQTYSTRQTYTLTPEGKLRWRDDQKQIVEWHRCGATTWDKDERRCQVRIQQGDVEVTLTADDDEVIINIIRLGNDPGSGELEPTNEQDLSVIVDGGQPLAMRPKRSDIGAYWGSSLGPWQKAAEVLGKGSKLSVSLRSGSVVLSGFPLIGSRDAINFLNQCRRRR